MFVVGRHLLLGDGGHQGLLRRLELGLVLRRVKDLGQEELGGGNGFKISFKGRDLKKIKYTCKDIRGEQQLEHF